MNICPKCKKDLLHLYKIHYGAEKGVNGKLPISRTLQCKKCNKIYIQSWDYEANKWVPDLN